ncbi:MAG: 5'-3' exonuclease H3TH domain-containing protein [Planctomycetota bacterium]
MPGALPADAVFLIDGHSYIYRAQFALAAIKTPRGEPCQAVLGFGNILVKFLRERQPAAVAVALDADVKQSFRQALDPAYKANREAAAPELLRQFGWCERLLCALGVTTFKQADFEADDVIATLTHRLVQQHRPVVVCSSDKDLGQLVQDGVSLLDLASGVVAGVDDVRARWGVWPHQLADLFGLIGDQIDNIPSVPGFGKKTAAAVLNAFATLDQIPTEVEPLRGVVRGADKLVRSWREHRGRALCSRELARARTDVPVTCGDLTYCGPRARELTELCEELGLKAFPERALRMLAARPRGSGSAPAGRQGLLFGE